MPNHQNDNSNQQFQTTTANANQSSQSGGVSIQPPGYRIGGANVTCPSNIASPGINSDTQTGLYAGGQSSTQSGFCINNPVFNPATMRNTLPNSHFQGEGSQELSEAMITLYGNPTGIELQSAIQTVARIRGLDPNEAMRQYQYAMQIKSQGQAYADQRALASGEQPHEVSPNFSAEDIAPGGIHHGFTGSTGQLRFGMVIGDVFGIDPVFGSLISPTGGAVGPGDTSISNVDPNSPTVLHGVVHDAAGYLLNAHGVGPGYNYLGSGIEPFSTTNPLTGQLSGMGYWNDTMYAESNVHRNANGQIVGADGRAGVGHFNLGNSNVDILTGDGFIGATPDPNGGTRYGLGASGGLLRGNIDLAQAGQWIWGEDVVPDSAIANLEFGAGTAAVDAWVNPNSGFSLGAQANLGEAALTVGNSSNQSSTDEQLRFGLSEGVGAAVRGHWGDSDGDGFREFGFGFDFGPVSADIKTEDPIRTIARSMPYFGPLSNILLPEGNLTHQTADYVGGLASDAWDAASGAADYVRQVGSQMWDTATQKAQELWNRASSFGVSMIDTIGEKARSAYDRARSIGATIIENGRNIAGGLWEEAKSRVGGLISRATSFGSRIISRVSGLASDAYARAREIGSNIVNRARGLAQDAYQSVRQKISQAKNRAREMARTMSNLARRKMEEIKNLASTAIEAAKRAVRGLAGDAYELIPSKVREIVESLKNTVSSGVQGLFNSAHNIFNHVSETVSGIGSSISGFVQEKYGQVRGLASSVFQSLRSAAGRVINGIRSAAQGVFDSVRGLASDAWDTVSGIGSSIVDGVSGAAHSVGSAISDGIGSIGRGIRNLFG